MRIFSGFEKKFLKRIINLEESKEKLVKPHTLLQGLLHVKSQVTIVGRDYSYELQEGENYYYKIELLGSPNDGLYEDYFEVIDRIHEANDLLNYLLKDGYLIRHEGGHAIGLLINMQYNLVEGKNGVEKIEIYINQLLHEFLEKCAYYYKPTEALRDLVKHNFKTQIERNNFWTRLISLISLTIAILSASSNIYFNSQKKQESSPQVIKLDTNTIDYFIRRSRREDTIVQLGTERQKINRDKRKVHVLEPQTQNSNKILFKRSASFQKKSLVPPATHPE